MAFGLFPEEDQQSIYFSRSDVEELLGSTCAFGFELDDEYWPTADHYVLAQLCKSTETQNQIRSFEHVQDAEKFLKWRFWLKKSDWKQRRQVLMTRAIYTRCKTHPELAQKLLDTGEQRLVENNAYDHYWGCGRDRRGENVYGRVLMNVRNKLREEQA